MPLRPRDQWKPNVKLQSAREQAFGKKSRTRFAGAVKRRCEQLYGGHCGVDHRKVRRWEEGACDPDVGHQQAICDVLGVPWEQREQLGFPVPSRREPALGVALNAEQCPACGSLVAAAALGAGAVDGEEGDANRWEFLWGGGATAVVAATERLQRLASALRLPAKPRPDAASLRVVADALSSTYTTAKADDVLSPARQHLSSVVSGLGQVGSSGQRAKLLAVGVDMACLCGWLARSSGAIGDAHAYFTLAADFAEASAQPELEARALGSQSILKSSLYVPGRENRNPREALELLERVLPGAEAGAFRAWMVVRAAEEHALLGERDACIRYMELAQSELGCGDGSGFFSIQGLFPGWGDANLAWKRGRCHALLGEAEPALAELSAATDTEGNGSIREPALIQADAALAWVVAGEPEATCEAAMRSLDVCEDIGYAVGIQRIYDVRARVDRRHEGLECVRVLDERLGWGDFSRAATVWT